MKRLSLFFMIFLPFFAMSQVNETFIDGNFTINPIWTGTTSNFIVNSSLQLQSQVIATSISYLFSPSEAFDDASWESQIMINYSSSSGTTSTSSSNFAAFYIASDRNDISSASNAYYVQVGGTRDAVSLYLKKGTKTDTIIGGIAKRVERNPLDIKINVTRDKLGNFALYSKLSGETDYVLEGKTQNNDLKFSSYVGLLFENSSKTGSAYSFDNIVVTGTKAVDLDPPVWKTLKLQPPNKLYLEFSEEMDFSKAAFSVNLGVEVPSSQSVSDDKKSVLLTFSSDFEKGKLYNLQISNLTDLAGNLLIMSNKKVGVCEPIGSTDLIFNEVMFENSDSSCEYIEIFNKSDKLLDVSGLIFTTRKTDGTLNTGNKIPSESVILPKSCLAMTSDAEKVRNFHFCPSESNIINTEWSQLNNESATLVLANSTKDSIYDVLTYNTKWHHILVKTPKGVALERINPEFPTQDPASWHSAASETNYGTPGYKNSQYREIDSNSQTEKFVWLEPEAFSPDNDGIDDVCLVKYKTESEGSVANVLILNAIGEKVFRLATNQLLASEGFFSWDGKTDKQKNANVGIYVVYFEMFNPKTGARKQLKLPIVVSSR